MNRILIGEILVHCNAVNNQYQHDSSVLCTFVPNKSFGQLTTNHICSRAFHSEFSYVEVWFTDQNSVPMEIEGRINLTLVINNKTGWIQEWSIGIVAALKFS